MQRRRASLSTVTVTGSPGGPGDSESGMAHGNMKPSAAVPGQVQPPWAESPPAGVRTSVTSVQADYRNNKRVQSCEPFILPRMRRKSIYTSCVSYYLIF